jgi:2-hydroxymuconate-semialdehyde hydrolase
VAEIKTGNWLDIRGLKLHYHRCGNGPPALLVHGYAHTWAMWEQPVERYLKTHYSCYSLDLPGHGQSDKPPLAWFTLDNFTETLIDFCYALNLKKILLIGYSMGGMISLNLAWQQPELVSRLITINAPIEGQFLRPFDAVLWLESLAHRPIAEKIFKLYQWSHWFTLPVELRRYANPRMIFSPSCYRVQHELAQTTVPALLGNFKAIRATDLRPHLGRLRLPTLAITSDHDRVVPPTHARQISRLAPQAQLAVISNCGHLPLDEQPALFEAVIREYLGIP